YLAAAETGRKWLAGTEADILLWGDIGDTEDANFNMRLLCAVADTVKQPGSIGIGDTIELPYEFPEELEELIFAATIAAVGPRKSTSQGKLREMLKESVGVLDAYVDTPPQGLPPTSQSSVMGSIGNIMASMWRLSDDGAFLDRSVNAYRAGLTAEFDSSRPMPWALAQNHLAAALQAQAKRDNSLEPLLGAADCYRGVAAALGSQHTNDWALAHINLGDVLAALSNHGDRIARLQEAAETYQRALLVFTRQTMPGPWSELMNQIGVTMMTIGENVAGTKALEQSAACFRQALEVRRRDVAPLLWAQTANNLGAVTFAIYRREANAVLLHEAAACFEGAAEVYSQHGRTRTADVARNNLDRVRETEGAV
ncbi:MAG: tetratricopeptide repeat protein, partial [Rhodospirillaceae bacterium]|nr:tetratricopeptide repeat protein [Rhodospirillaceae bacterium]